MTRQQWLFVFAGVLIVLAGCVAGGLIEPDEQLAGAVPLGLFGAGLFVWGHV